MSSVTVFNELQNRRPDLVARLFEPVHVDIRDKDVDAPDSTLSIPPCCHADGRLRTFYHSDYFKSAARHSDVDLSDLKLELFEVYESIANEPGIYCDMDLEPGDIQLLSNHVALHARTAYTDHENPEERRHLLRLWLSL